MNAESLSMYVNVTAHACVPAYKHTLIHIKEYLKSPLQISKEPYKNITHTDHPRSPGDQFVHNFPDYLDYPPAGPPPPPPRVFPPPPRGGGGGGPPNKPFLGAPQIFKTRENVYLI